MDLITPDIGLIFWSTLFFLVLLLILGKFAWPSILTAIRIRNESIRNALNAADKAKKEMAKLKAENERMLEEARIERDALLKEARQVKEQFIADAREKAEEEAKRLIKNARETIRDERSAAIREIRVQMAKLSVEIAEKILREKLKDGKEQKKLINKLISEADLN
ncbi:MAG: F0F1 ATP synthase subunit B [Bacteroidales bacterium]